MLHLPLCLTQLCSKFDSASKLLKSLQTMQGLMFPPPHLLLATHHFLEPLQKSYTPNFCSLILISYSSRSFNPSVLLHSIRTTWKPETKQKVKIVIIDRALLISLDFLVESPQTISVCTIIPKCSMYTKSLRFLLNRSSCSLLHPENLRPLDMLSVNFQPPPHSAH